MFGRESCKVIIFFVVPIAWTIYTDGGEYLCTPNAAVCF